MSYTELFYWLTVADNAKTLFITGLVIFTIIAVIATLWFVIDRSGDDFSTSKSSGAERAKKWMWWSYPLTFFFWALFIFTPSKRDALLIIAGGQTMEFLTTDESAKQIPHELSNFILSELKNMAVEAQVDLGIAKTKEEILEQAKKMSSEEIIELMKTDPDFKKVLLNE